MYCALPLFFKMYKLKAKNTCSALMNTLHLYQNVILNFDRSICFLLYFIFSFNF